MPYYKDLTYFSTIDTEPKAYWLGFLYADGWVFGGRLGIKLQRRDREHLVAFSQAIFGCDRVKDGVSRGSTLDTGRVIRGGDHSVVTVSSVEMVGQLAVLGMVPKKSLTHGLPTATQVPSHLLRHFIRGYFDGDGSISHRTAQGAKRWIVTVLSSRPFCERFTEHVETTLGIHITPTKREGKISAVSISGNRQIKRFMDWLYDEATVWLPRKRALYDELRADLIRIDSKPRTSRYRNVTYDRTRGKWVATVRVNKRTVHVGRFVTEEEAYQAQRAYLRAGKASKPDALGPRAGERLAEPQKEPLAYV